MNQKLNETLTPIFGGITTTLASVGYQETLSNIYLVFLIIGSVLTVISLGITLFSKIKEALKDKKITEEETKDIQKTITDMTDVVEKTKDEIKDQEDKK